MFKNSWPLVMFAVTLAASTARSYKVMWRVLSVDTHRTQGDFSFRVGRRAEGPPSWRIR